jgi:hypothetical protein
VIERGHAPGEGVRVLVGQRKGHAEAQVLGHAGHRRHQQQRVVHRHLHAAAQGRLGAALVDVVDAQHVGDEQCVEQAAFEQAGQVGPVVQAVERHAGVARMAPQAGDWWLAAFMLKALKRIGRGMVGALRSRQHGSRVDRVGHLQLAWNQAQALEGVGQLLLFGNDLRGDGHGVVVAPFAGFQHVGADPQLRRQQRGDFGGLGVGPLADLASSAKKVFSSARCWSA